MNNFVIISNKIKDNNLEFASRIKSNLEMKYKGIVVRLIEMSEAADADYAGTECIVVMGGDGTLLRVARDLYSLSIPLIGINLGDLGFLAEVEKNSIDAAFEQLVNDNYQIDERMMLSGEVVIGGKVVRKAHSLNDVVLSRRGTLQMIGYRIFVNGLYLNDFYADGIIVSTPTGSTGYNMSVGGSIVEPRAQLMLLTPVSPHSLTARSIVLSPYDKVEVALLPPKGIKPAEVGVYFDGNGDEVLTTDDRVIISKASKVTRLCRLSDMSFLEVLHKKMNS